MAGGPINKRFDPNEVGSNAALYTSRIMVYVAYVNADGNKQRMLCANRAKLEAVVSNMQLVKSDFDIDFRSGNISGAYDDVLVEDLWTALPEVPETPRNIMFEGPEIRTYIDDGKEYSMKMYTAVEC